MAPWSFLSAAVSPPHTASRTRHANRLVAVSGTQTTFVEVSSPNVSSTSRKEEDTFGFKMTSAIVAAASFAASLGSNATTLASDASAARSVCSSCWVWRGVSQLCRTRRSRRETRRVGSFSVSSLNSFATEFACAASVSVAAAAVSNSHPKSVFDMAYTSRWSSRDAIALDVAAPKVSSSVFFACSVSPGVRGMSYHRRAPASNETTRRGSRSSRETEDSREESPRAAFAEDVGGGLPIRTLGGILAVLPSPTCTRTPQITCPGLAMERTHDTGPGHGASTPPCDCSLCNAKRTASDVFPLKNAPPKFVSSVTHTERSKKSKGNLGSDISGKADDEGSSFGTPSSSTESPVPVASLVALADLAVAFAAARSSCRR
mmetsp:Transcript_13877/g.45918  ORF Transcript_13877/g.45918 Transcript_13877/m.45918 type:complete len:375 (-) Transcript_13877:1344-2468(-)